MALVPLSGEVLRDQVAWGGTLVIRALDWASAQSDSPGLEWQAAYRLAVLGGWLIAALPIGMALALHRVRLRQHRDDLTALQHRGRAGWQVLGLLVGTVLILIWPAPLAPGFKPVWAGWVLLVLCRRV
ncbi:MAG: hypothetical protein KGK17_00045 [Betaproteobacteria bacterium]|nr:hypothetical protein [Betaproteobacteria bacterium]